MQAPYNQFVFLPEADSVRRSVPEMEAGQWAIFTEIVRYGHVVVLSFNQVTDSYTLMSMLLDERSRDAVLELFRLGWLQVNAFSSYYTLADYINRATSRKVEKDETFLFSWLPVQKDETFLLQLIHQAVSSSNTAMFPPTDQPAPEELWMLRAQLQQLLRTPHLTPQQYHDLEGLDQEISQHYAGRMGDIGRFISTVVQVSASSPAIHPKKEARDMRYDYLSLLQALLRDPTIDWTGAGLEPDLADLLSSARRHLGQLLHLPQGARLRTRNNRSDWIAALVAWDAVPPPGHTAPDHTALQMANALVDLCHHYASEESVLHVLKGFDDRGLSPLPPPGPRGAGFSTQWLVKYANARALFHNPDFVAEFVCRLRDYWHTHASCFLAPDTNTLLTYCPVRHWNLWDYRVIRRSQAGVLHTPDWNLAVAAVHGQQPHLPQASPTCTYEAQTRAFRPQWRRWRFTHSLWSGLGLLASFLLILVLAHSETFLDTVVGRILPIDLSQASPLTTFLVSALVTSALVSLLSALIPWAVSLVRRRLSPACHPFEIPDILDFYKKLGRSLSGWLTTTFLYRNKYRSYRRLSRDTRPRA